MKRIILLSLLLSVVSAGALQAQYFGRNKPRYQEQDFIVTQTEHFEIYEYLDNPEKLKELAAAAELWYAMHNAVLQNPFTQKNPLIIYNDHASFQQTTTVQGDINVGTGGVVVPAPGELSISSVPPRSRARSCIERSPRCPGNSPAGSKPCPSS